MPTYAPDDLLTREEAAAYTGFALTYLHGEASRGIFVKPYKIAGSSHLYRRRDLDAWRDERARLGRPRPIYHRRAWR